MMADRVPPFSEEAEKGALGAILLDADRLMPAAVRMGIMPESFYLAMHRAVWEAMTELWNEGGRHHIDAISMTERLRQKGQLDAIGGSVTLDRMIDGCPSATHGEYYLDIIRQKWILRMEIVIAREVELEAHTAERGDDHLKTIPDRFLGLAKDVVQEVTIDQMLDQQVVDWEAARTARESGGDPMPGLALPWKELTELWGSLVTGLHLLAARTSCGKTTLEGQIATHLAMAGKAVGRCTLDMKAQKLVGRMLAAEAEVSGAKLNFGYAGGLDLQRVKDSRDVMKAAGMRMWINWQDRDITGICSWARGLKLRKGLDLLTVDYAELVGASELGRNASDDMRRVTHVSHRLKELAYQLDIPVLLLSQLDRSLEKEDRPPRMSDLRWSGALEQDADVIVFLWIDQKKRNQMDDPSKGGAIGATKHKRPVWVDKAKDKDGGQGRVPVWLYPPYFRFGPAESRVTGSGKQEHFTDDGLPGEEKTEARSQKKPDSSAMNLEFPEVPPDPEEVE